MIPAPPTLEPAVATRAIPAALCAALLMAGCAPPSGDTAAWGEPAWGGDLPERPSLEEGAAGELLYTGPAGSYRIPYRVEAGKVLAGGHILMGRVEDFHAGARAPRSAGMAVIRLRPRGLPPRLERAAVARRGGGPRPARLHGAGPVGAGLVRGRALRPGRRAR